MELTILLNCILIVAARVADVSLGTIRTIFVVHGRRGVAFMLGFVEILIWIIVISKVVDSLDQPEYVVSYAFGFALGTYCGVTIERWIAVGQQAVRVFTSYGQEMATKLRQSGYNVTAFQGEGKEGPIHLLFTEISRRRIPGLLSLVDQLDPDSFYVIDDVRAYPKRKVQFFNPTGWRAVVKKK